MPRFQFSLKTLLVAVTIAAVVVAAVRWHANRLDVLADSFVSLIHESRYKEAEAVAMEARRLYPDELIATQMETTCRIFFHHERLPEPPAWDIDIAAWQKLADDRRATMKDQVPRSGTQE